MPIFSTIKEEELGKVGRVASKDTLLGIAGAAGTFVGKVENAARRITRRCR